MTGPETAPQTAETGVNDVIDHLANVAPGSPVAELRAERPALTRFSQASYVSLFEPENDNGLSRKERDLVALRVALLTPDERLARWHEDRLAADSGTMATVSAVSAFPAVSPELTPREVAILRHTDLVTQRPVDAEPSDVEALRTAGLSTREIVTLSQLIGFLAYEVRVLAALRALGDPA